MINSTQLPFIVGISVLTTTSLLYYLYRKTRNNYVKVCNVKKLFIYPIKAVKGVQVNQLEITKYGVKYGPFTDRSWILLDNANNVIGMKSFPKLVLTRTRILGQEVWVDGPDMPTLKLRYIDEINDSHNIISINLYGQRIKGIDCGPEVNQWFETFLSRPGVRLLQHHHSFDFRDSDTYKRRKDDKDYPIIYQNKSGLHLINESSISDLNSRFPEGEDHAIDENFRPNLVVEYREPWAEDKWKWMRINGVTFIRLIACDRLRIMGKQLWVDGPDMPTLKLTYIEQLNDNHKIISFNLDGQIIKGIDCGPEANQWFETFIGRPGVRLLQHHQSFDFRDSESGKRRNDDKDFPIIYQNRSGLHLVNESSVSDLNSQFPEGEDQVLNDNFRPTVLVEYPEPWAEDNWKWMRINGVNFLMLISCDRCPTTCVDPETGVGLTEYFLCNFIEGLDLLDICDKYSQFYDIMSRSTGGFGHGYFGRTFKKLFIYPIKGLKGVEVNQLEITKYGVKYGIFKDRLRIMGKQLWVDGPDMPTLKLTYIEQLNDNHEIISFKMYTPNSSEQMDGQVIKGIDCGPEANQWFETFIGRPGVRLLQHHHSFDFRDSDSSKRRKDDKDFPIIYQNRSGLHLVNESSVNDLNSQFPEGEDQVSYDNFRPAVLVEYPEPWAEDNWKWMRINGVNFLMLISCDRCPTICVDPETGAKVDTFKTLKK
ncbi:unnamed protein product [Oppiella nova]|uniref:MOSC domain-containing protein n=1 Tax=Oppiella nova TaxID=334625 RepID=A0A7R9QNT0_9ACAR|nr:unnamed protein product [Oppiella nova]CAG2168667.1 unnamed protein product [Oppiella nova]